MPHFYETFPPHLQQWALEQSVFFTASAPTYGRHVNLSPKGVPSSTFAILDESHAAYLDLTGSGAETISHIYENGRVTVMFCSFSNNPRIMRLFCTGRVVELDNAAFQDTVASMSLVEIPGTRAVVLLDIWKVQTSCGYGVPLTEKTETDGAIMEPALSENGDLAQTPCTCFNDRHMLEQWLANTINKKKLEDYKIRLNSRSLDGLPALQAARRMGGERLWIGDARLRAHHMLYHPVAVFSGMLLGITLALLFMRPSRPYTSVKSPAIRVDKMVATISLVVYRLLLLTESGWNVILGYLVK